MRTYVARLAIIASLVIIVLPGFACSDTGGADVYLENVNIGSVSMEGKPVTGLPTGNVNIVLKTGANKIYVSQSGGKTTLKLMPSTAVITSDSTGVTFTGVNPDQVELKWDAIKTK
jgi:hypothetical protein